MLKQRTVSLGFVFTENKSKEAIAHPCAQEHVRHQKRKKDRRLKSKLWKVVCKQHTTAKASIGRKAALGLRHIGLFEAPSPSSANYRAGGVTSLSGQRLAFCKRWRNKPGQNETIAAAKRIKVKDWKKLF